MVVETSWAGELQDVIPGSGDKGGSCSDAEHALEVFTNASDHGDGYAMNKSSNAQMLLNIRTSLQKANRDDSFVEQALVCSSKSSP